jgi:hypothetical protein
MPPSVIMVAPAAAVPPIAASSSPHVQVVLPCPAGGGVVMAPVVSVATRADGPRPLRREIRRIARHARKRQSAGVSAGRVIVGSGRAHEGRARCIDIALQRQKVRLCMSGHRPQDGKRCENLCCAFHRAQTGARRLPATRMGHGRSLARSAFFSITAQTPGIAFQLLAPMRPGARLTPNTL